MPTYTYNENLTSSLDHARFHIGDTDTTHPLLSNETISAQLIQFGWKQGMYNLVNGLLSRFGQEPIKYAEGGGALINLEGRLKEWRRLLEDILEDKIPDPDVTFAGGPKSLDSIAAANEANW